MSPMQHASLTHSNHLVLLGGIYKKFRSQAYIGETICLRPYLVHVSMHAWKENIVEMYGPSGFLPRFMDLQLMHLH